jgi:hypothetical protein
MTAVPRGFDTRSAVRALGRVIRSQAAELKLLRIATQDLTNALHLLRLDMQTRLPKAPGTEPALAGPYWEARFKALYARGQEALEPTYPDRLYDEERIRQIEDKIAAKMREG